MSEAAYVSDLDYSFQDRMPNSCAYAVCEKACLWVQGAEMTHHDVGEHGVNIQNPKFLRDLEAKVEKHKPSFIFVISAVSLTN